MLVLSRRIGERIIVGDNIAIVVNRICGNRVVLGIDAPKDVRIMRAELPSIVRQIQEEKEVPQSDSGSAADHASEPRPDMYIRRRDAC